MDWKRGQSASVKKSFGQTDIVRRKDANDVDNQGNIRRSKVRESGEDHEVLSFKEPNAISLKLEKSHEATRNSVVLKVPGLFGSKNDLSGLQADPDAAAQDDHSNTDVVYYQQVDQQVDQGRHRPKIGGLKTQIRE